MLIHQQQQQQEMFAKHKHLNATSSSFNQILVPNNNLNSPQLDSVIIRNLTYEVGRGRNKKTILNKINLTVPEGSIYGLLGPSGCGKTTMLRCVVGRIRVRSGHVMVFGFTPGAGEGGEVPGREVGYMPQEISIYEDFTIEETLIYFGKINRMRTSEIKKRIQFLLKFLDLPSKRRLVVNLSGGQKRRVSLAAALVHSPPLLILDEPTVGVDPLLRQSIWQHLVTLTKRERISVIITTHYIEEARQANVVGLMRHGKILAENSPEELMRIHNLNNLEDVFLKLCVTDSSRRAATLAQTSGRNHLDHHPHNNHELDDDDDDNDDDYEHETNYAPNGRHNQSQTSRSRVRQEEEEEERRGGGNNKGVSGIGTGVAVVDYSHRWDSLSRKQQQQRRRRQTQAATSIAIHTGTNEIKFHHHQPNHRHHPGGYVNEAVEVFSSEEEEDMSGRSSISESSFREGPVIKQGAGASAAKQLATSTIGEAATGGSETNYRHLIERAGPIYHNSTNPEHTEDYLTLQALRWAAKRNNEAAKHTNLLTAMNLRGGYVAGGGSLNKNKQQQTTKEQLHGSVTHANDSNLVQWCKTLMAVTWKNYIRLRRNPPVLVFQFMLPAIQVILFCLCIGGDPFDVPVAIVNDELVPRSSLQFLNGLNRKIIRQVKYDNLTSAIEAVKRGTVWGAIHIPDRYSQNLQSRLIMGEEVNNETISNGTIRVYPDLTNLHLAIALETTFRETFINFARNSLEEMGYDRSLADLPIQVGKPVYGSLKKDGYLEFMAPGVVISISYVMATGLTALAFILERRDGLLERSLVSGVQTSQILLAHAINQVVVMIIQIFLVLGCTFLVFEIPSRGPFFWVLLLILLQGCTGMAFGLLVSAVCKEENTAVMMVVGTFYTNLILAGIIWPIEAMPHWLRPLSYAQPQTLPTDTLRHILSRGWGITESGVLLGFAVTIGWLMIFLFAAGLIFKYSRG